MAKVRRKKRQGAAPRRGGRMEARSRDFAPPAASSLELLGNQYHYLQDNFDDLFALCTTDEQKQDLRRDLLVAQRNLNAARRAIIDEGDAHVQSLNQEISQGQQQIAQLQIDEQNISQILNTMTAVVRTASSLISLIGA